MGTNQLAGCRVVVSVFLFVTVGNIAVFVINPYSNELLWLCLNILAIAVASLLTRLSFLLL